jgi:hypothetical protein
MLLRLWEPRCADRSAGARNDLFSKFDQLTQIAADDLEAGSVVAVSDQLEEEVRETGCWFFAVG